MEAMDMYLFALDIVHILICQMKFRKYVSFSSHFTFVYLNFGLKPQKLYL